MGGFSAARDFGGDGTFTRLGCDVTFPPDPLSCVCMKTRLRRFLVGLIAALLCFGVVQVWRVLSAQREKDLHQKVLDVLPEVAQHIRDFHRTKVVDGRKVWEVSARDAQYFEDERTVVVSEPAVSFFLKDGREMALRGDEGKVVIGDHELERVELSGDMKARFGEYALETASARYEGATDSVVASGAVRIYSDQLDIRGDGLTLQVSAQRLSLDGNVHMVLRPGM